MKLLALSLYALAAQASWFTGEKQAYSSWDDAQLKQWLDYHSIQAPKGFSTQELKDLVKANWAKSQEWTAGQYSNAQKVFQDTKSDAYKDWDESQLRKYLVDQGVIAPAGPKESLVHLMKQQYASYTSYASQASASASTLLYGDKTVQASASVSSAVSAASSSVASLTATATEEVANRLDATKDYIWSNWSESDFRAYLQSKGVIAPPKSTREELIDMVQSTYGAVWQSWTDSYTHHWLVSHGIIRSEAEKKRDEYVKLMKSYYYDVNDKVWDTWTDSQLRQWLLDHDVIKTDAQIKREKMIKLVKDNYNHALDTIYAGWTDSQMRDWLIENGYMRSETQVKRDELIKLFNDKYADASTKTAAYLTWPDARLRAYLRNHDLDRAESLLPTSRPGLIQEVRIRWVQTTSTVEAIYARLKELLNNGVVFAEDKVGEALAILAGTSQQAKKTGKKYAADAVKEYQVRLANAEKVLSSASAEAAKASKTAEAKVVKEKNVEFASASSAVSSLSAELAKASKKAKAEL